MLLAYTLGTPMEEAAWCRDIDGNGTEDLLVRDEGREFVLGRVAKP